MDNMNKVISFILGLVVVVVFIAILSGKIGIGKTILTSLKRPTPTMTPAPTSQPQPTIVIDQPGTGSTGTTTTGGYSSTTNPKPQPKGGTYTNNIPSTGSETLLLPLFSSIGALGVYLKRKAKLS